MLPAFHILYLVKEQDGLVIGEGSLRLQNQVKIILVHIADSFIIEIDIDNLLYLMSCPQQLLSLLVEEIGFPCLTHPDKHIITPFFKSERAFYQLNLRDYILILQNDPPHYFSIHT